MDLKLNWVLPDLMCSTLSTVASQYSGLDHNFWEAPFQSTLESLIPHWIFHQRWVDLIQYSRKIFQDILYTRFCGFWGHTWKALLKVSYAIKSVLGTPLCQALDVLFNLMTSILDSVFSTLNCTPVFWPLYLPYKLHKTETLWGRTRRWTKSDCVLHMA